MRVQRRSHCVTMVMRERGGLGHICYVDVAVNEVEDGRGEATVRQVRIRLGKGLGCVIYQTYMMLRQAHQVSEIPHLKPANPKARL